MPLLAIVAITFFVIFDFDLIWRISGPFCLGEFLADKPIVAYFCVSRYFFGVTQ